MKMFLETSILTKEIQDLDFDLTGSQTLGQALDTRVYDCLKQGIPVHEFKIVLDPDDWMKLVREYHNMHTNAAQPVNNAKPTKRGL